MASQNQIDPNILITGFFTLGGAILGFIATIIKDIVQSNNELKKERIKIHDEKRINAYKHLIVFHKSLIRILFPMNENTLDNLKDLFEKDFNHQLIYDYPFLSKKIIRVIDYFEGIYRISINPDLMEYNDPGKMLKKEYAKKLSILDKEIRKGLMKY